MAGLLDLFDPAARARNDALLQLERNPTTRKKIEETRLDAMKYAPTFLDIGAFRQGQPFTELQKSLQADIGTRASGTFKPSKVDRFGEAKGNYAVADLSGSQVVPMNNPGDPSWSNRGGTPLEITVTGGNRPVSLAGMFGRGLPAVQPQQPTVVAGADPGLGGNMFGVEQTYFPPEQVPPPGIEPTKWAEASATPQTAVLSDLFTTDPTSGTTKAGYVYKNGQRVGKADWTAGQTPAGQYDLANALAASNAKNATGTLKTGGVFESGIKVGNNRAPGISAEQAYDIVNQSARSEAISRSSDPSGNSARASLASQWGFD